jgi:hypothetical protein
MLLAGVLALNVTQQSAEVVITATPSDTPTSTATQTATSTATPTPTVTPSPTPTPIPASVIIGAINQTAFLESARFVLNLPDLYAENEQPGILPGTRSLRYNANVTVTAGVDFALLTPANILVNGTTITVRLPSPQVRDCILDEASSSYYERNCDAAGVVDIGCGGLEEILRQNALIASTQADHQQILQEAHRSASEIVQKLVLTVAGVQQVVIERAPDPLPILSAGGTCALITP